MKKFMISNGKFITLNSSFGIKSSASPWEPPIQTGDKLKITQVYNAVKTRTKLSLE